MPLAGPVVKKISLIKRIAEVEPLLRYTYENEAAYLFGNASQIPQILAILVAPTAGRRPYHSLAKLVAPRLAKVVSSPGDSHRLRRQIFIPSVSLFPLSASITMRGVLVASSPGAGRSRTTSVNRLA
jgi:hypothetical protein